MRYAATLLALAASLAACATTPGGDPVDAQTEQRTAVLFVERQASEGTTSVAHVGARFVQFAGIDPTMLPDLLGTPSIPTVMGTCAERADTSVDTANGRAEAHLLDVGPIEVRAGDRVLQLEPRRFPDLWNVVSGVIYSTDDELPLGAWRFTAPGNPQSRVGAFDVEERAPEDLAGVTVAEQPLAPGGAVAVPRRGFSVRWARGDQGDAVSVSFEGGGGERPVTIVCAARDEGSIELDASWAERVADLAREGATVTVHRVRARGFSAPSLEAGHIVFDLSLRGTLRAE